MDPLLAEQYASKFINNNKNYASNNEANNWLKKTSAVHKAIQGLANGTLEVDQINLKKYGILNDKEKEEENKRLAKVRQELVEREVKEKKRMKEEERKKWWNDATILFGNEDNKVEKSENENDEHIKQRIIERYSSNYTRWSESNYKPDDEATKEETELIEQEKENLLLLEFESKNKEWCDAMSNDMQRRKDGTVKREKEGDKNRKEGNSFFQKRQYDKALSYYFKAFEFYPFNVIVLTNMALCYGKLNQLEDAIEFCNRACFVDKSYIKAFYNRALFYIQIKSYNEALKDLEICKEIDSESSVVIDKYEWLLQEINYEAEEDHIRKIVVDNDRKYCNVTHEKLKNEPSPTENKTKFNIDVVSTLQTLSQDKDSDLINQCHTIDEIINKIQKYDIAQDAGKDAELNARHSFDLLGAILIEKMKSQPSAKTYLRIAGHLENICNIVSKCKGRGYTSRKVLFDIISIAVMDEQRSINIVMKNKIIFTAMLSLNVKLQSKDGCSSIQERISATKTILTLLVNCKNKNCYFEKGFKKHKDFILSICSLIDDVCDDSIDEKESAIVVCTDLLSSLCDKFEKHKFWKDFSPSQHTQNDNPIATLSKALLYFKENKKYKLIRTCLVEAILNFSRIEQIRLFFNVPLEMQIHEKHSLCCIHILLSLAMSYKSEEEKCRNFALMSLANSTVKRVGENNDMMKNSMSECGAISALLNLSTSTYCSISIKSNASELLSRCISIPEGFNSFLKCPNSVLKLISTCTTVLDDGWFQSKTSENNSKYYGSYIANIIRILASIKQGPFDDEYYKVLISLLPVPKRITGKATAQSVCQAPEIPVKGSAHEVASSSSSFSVNVSKAIISFLDSNKKGTHFLLYSYDLVERLICILANYSSMHPLCVKNSACILARLVKYDHEIKKHCTKLRGMEIMMELGKKGTI